MAKLRKMLGDVNSAVCRDIMALISSQSRKTIEKWAVEYAAENVLGVYEAACPGENIIVDTVESCRRYMRGEMKLSRLRPELADARKLASGTKGDVAQAAARAVATACAAVQTPTNSFGFLMYAAAARAYSVLGTDKPQADYDAYAEQEMERALMSLRNATVDNEPEPLNLDWHC